MLRQVMVLGAVAALALSGCGKPADPAAKASAAARPAVLNFSILSAEDQANFGPLWKPLLDDLSKAVGIPVKPFFSSNYSALVQAIRFNQTQIGWFSAKPALETTRTANAEVFARTVDLRGHDQYQSVLIVKKGSGMTLDRILKCDKTLSFGMGDPQSTSGTMAPMHYLFGPKKIDPKACFKTVRNAAHQPNLFSVANGLLDASTNNSVGLDFARVGSVQAKAAYDKVQVVWNSPNLPESAFVYRKELDPALKAKIRDFFLTYGKAPGAEGERQRKIMAPLHYSGFNPADDGYLQPVIEMEKDQAPAKAAS